MPPRFTVQEESKEGAELIESSQLFSKSRELAEETKLERISERNSTDEIDHSAMLDTCTKIKATLIRVTGEFEGVCIDFMHSTYNTTYLGFNVCKSCVRVAMMVDHDEIDFDFGSL